MKKDLLVAIWLLHIEVNFIGRQLGIAAPVHCQLLVIRRIVRVVGHLISFGSIPDRSTFFLF